MAELAITDLAKIFPDGTRALTEISLTVADGERLVLVGPSGCGKSTLLRCIAGLEQASGGSIRLGERDLTHLPPERRHLAMVFQSYALYPHMSVADNLGFPLRMAKVPKAERQRRVRELADTMAIADLLDRRPAQLSGGQRQRVAMGRALVRDADLFLLDEPLSNLDARLRGEMRVEIAELQRRLGITTVYVTHDQVEAMTMGDRLCVLRGGRIQQLGTADECYHRPRNRFVAGFLGSPPVHLFEASLARGEAGWRLAWPGGAVAADRLVAARPELAELAERATTWGLRPEALTRDPAGELVTTIEHVEHLGHELLLHCRAPWRVADDDPELPSGPLVLREAVSAHRPAVGDEVRLGIQPAAVLVFDQHGESISA